MSFVIQHIDSIIMILIGGGLAATAKAPTGTARTVTAVVGPALIVIGFLLLLVEGAPRIQLTDDGAAEAMFPGPPKRSTINNPVGDRAYRIVSYSYDVPGRDTTLLLSRSPVPEGNESTSDDDGVGGVISYFQQQGFELEQQRSLSIGSASGHELVFNTPSGKHRSVVRFAIASGQIYRAIGTTATNGGDHQMVQNFIESFRVR